MKQASEDGEICVVGIGASAGGLDAAKKFLHALPADSGLAFILVQHLEPTHESMMAELLRNFTAMPVTQASDGMVLCVNHIYIIPPGLYLSLKAGILHLSVPTARHGRRLPFDFLLQSLAASVGRLAVCVILSGSGSDGTKGLQAIKQAGGLVLVQTPEEAEYDGMPRSAIASGQVDFVLPVEEIAEKLAAYRQRLSVPDTEQSTARIVALLQERTPHDFSLYKPGTLQRRIARRMALAELAPDNVEGYLAMLQRDQAECNALADDMLINVTGFFRDPETFEMLAERIIPDMVKAAVDQPIRIWIAGCSTGEETYSLAILFLEQFAAVKSPAKLQIFASDVDERAVRFARDGLYPAAIEAQVSAPRLARFFRRDEQGYRIAADVRENIVFAAQDVLADPPFSKLDFISCRNLLIYLRPEAQSRIVTIFHFALRKNGFLLLGSAETVGGADARFDVVSKSGRLYRKTSVGGAGVMPVALKGAGGRTAARPEPARPVLRGTDIAELSRRLVLAAFAPAAILINARRECLYSFGPTEIYLRVAPGYATHDLLAMIRPVLRARVKAAIAQADAENTRIVTAGGRVSRDGRNVTFDIDVRPVMNDGERLFLICFVDQPRTALPRRQPNSPQDVSRIAELEQELAATRGELQTALHSLDAAAQEQNAVHEEARSVGEEYQSTNEELLTSKEELQSLNEELTALNSQLQETLERSRTTSNDLQNVLYSTDVATLFLDSQLNIRFFTPPTKALFTLIPGDIGRPLADLHSLSADAALAADAEQVLRDFHPVERQIQNNGGVWFSRRILPYRTHDGAVAGVVITFIDITERKLAAAALEESRLDSERANIAKTRFLAAASHDLRQPLQTLTLLNSLLAKLATDPAAQRLLGKLDDTTTAMTTILNTLLDINQIDAGIVQVAMEPFAIGELLRKLGSEFDELAASRGLKLRVVASSLVILTDPRILEQMLRNLLANALKYTIKGGIVLGCRRSGQNAEIQVWDSGLGIPDAELGAIFDEYHQVDNAARERSRGLGLGLSIVQRLGALLNHRIGVRSIYGKGSVFTVAARLCETQPAAENQPVPLTAQPNLPLPRKRQASILIIEDDPDVRLLLEMSLIEEGHCVASAQDGRMAIEILAARKFVPDLILADYNLPNAVNGLEIVHQLRQIIGHQVAVVIVTGDTATQTRREIADAGCLQLNKPMKLKDLNDTIQQILPPPAPNPVNGAAAGQATVYVIDDDRMIRDTIRGVLEANSYHVVTFNDGESFLSAPAKAANACLLLDANLPGMSGLEVLKALLSSATHLPTIMFTGEPDIKTAVRAMKVGAVDFIEKPVAHGELLACVARALSQGRDEGHAHEQQQRAASQIASLTSRQRQIMDLVLAGTASKNIAADLGISQRTVEKHRATIMEKMGTKSTPALARLAMLGSKAGS